MADILTTSKDTILYFELFKKHNKFDYKAFVFDINELFHDFLTYFPNLIKRFYHISNENQEKTSKRNEGVILSLISTKYKKRAASSSLKRNKDKSNDTINLSQSSLFNTFINRKANKTRNETKSTIIHLKSRKITLDENEIKKICGGYKQTKKNQHFRILPDNMASPDELCFEKSSLAIEDTENLIDNELINSVFNSKTVFHRDEAQTQSIHATISKPIVLPRISENKMSKKEKKMEKEFQSQMLIPLKGETFKYMKPIVDMRSFKNLKYMAKDYLNRFIIKKK